MSAVRNLTQVEAAERARLLEVVSYEVTLDLRGAVTGQPAFRSTTQVRFRCARPGASTVVDVAAQRIRAATLNGRPVPVTGWSAGSGLPLPDLAADNLLVVDADFGYSRTGQGLHRSTDPADGEVYLYSQFQTADAQRAFACFDQPDLKAAFTWHATVPGHWKAISNGRVRERAEGSDGSITVHFETTPRMSTYVTALCAGPYHEVRRVHDGIDLGYWCRASMASHLDVEDLHRLTTAGFDFFHDRFGVRYPLPSYDQVWVPEFNAGAMENFGAVVLSETLTLFRSRVTDFEYEQRANTILHELAHMWFGDLVTMRWWDDLWLNESFAEWASHWCNARATRFTDAWTTFLSVRKAWGYRQDQLSSTHPVYTPMPDVEAVEVNFDGITYAKGASVIKQLVAYVGEEPFLTGLRAYFAAHAWGNASFDDLLDALERSSGRPVRAFAAQWLETAQVNTLRPELVIDQDGRYQSVAVRQEAPAEHPTLRIHRLRIGLYDQADPGGKLVRRDQLELDVAGERTTVPGLVGVPAADLLLLNDDDLTYAKIRLDPRSLATAVEHLAGLDSSLARGLIWAAAWDMVRDAELPTRSWIGLVCRALPFETDINLVTSVLRQAAGAVSQYADPAWAPTGWHLLAETARAQVASAGAGPQLAWARAFADAARTPDELALLRAWRDGVGVPDGLVVDTELRWMLLRALVAQGAAGAPEIDADLAADPTSGGEREAATALALRPDPQVKARVWDELTGPDAPPNWRHRALLQGFWHPSQVELTRPFVARFLGVAGEIWSRRSREQAQEFLTIGFPYYHVSDQTVAATDRWLAEPGHPAPARRLVAEGRDSLLRALAARSADAAAG